MPDNVTEEMLREAELRHLNAQAERDNAERSRIKQEEEEITRRLGQRWWHVRIPVLLQIVVAGVVAGGLIGGFLLDHFLAVTELIQKQQTALETEFNDNLERMEEERAENRRELSELSNKLQSFAEDNDVLRRELSAAVATSAKELELLQATLNEQEALQAAAEQTSDQQPEIKAAKLRGRAAIDELKEEVMRLSDASKRTEARSAEISVQRFSNTLREYVWRMRDEQASGTDLYYQFDAQGRMRLSDSPWARTWITSRRTWHIDGDSLIIEGGNNPRSTFPLSGVLPDMTHIKGQSEYKGKTFETSLRRDRSAYGWARPTN